MSLESGRCIFIGYVAYSNPACLGIDPVTTINLSNLIYSLLERKIH